MLLVQGVEWRTTQKQVENELTSIQLLEEWNFTPFGVI